MGKKRTHARSSSRAFLRQLTNIVSIKVEIGIFPHFLLFPALRTKTTTNSKYFIYASENLLIYTNCFTRVC